MAVTVALSGRGATPYALIGMMHLRRVNSDHIEILMWHDVQVSKCRGVEMSRCRDVQRKLSLLTTHVYPSSLRLGFQFELSCERKSILT